MPEMQKMFLIVSRTQLTNLYIIQLCVLVMAQDWIGAGIH